ncbi:XCL1 protein, partial [Dicrurus megarhynchus]|nr:XCL1 protein [Dicrurus megarhynchus]
IFILFSFICFSLLGSASSQSMRKYSCALLSPRQLNIRNLVSYEKQQVPTDAIMFINAKGIRICVRANQPWVKTAVKRIDERRAAK